MSGLLAGLLVRKRLVGALAGLLLLVGVAAWLTMPRQEDPSFVARFATVVVPFPGADPLQVERRILEPLEDELAAVDALREVESTARSGVAVMQLRLDDTIYDTDAAWDDVRRALDDATLPDGAGPLRFDDDIGDPASIVLLVTGSPAPLALRDGARELEVALRQVPGVSRVDWVGDPGVELRVTVEPGAARRLGIAPERLATLLASRNLTLPGGALQADGRTVVLRPHTELASVDELRATPIPLPGGAAVPLGEIAQVALTPVEPAPARVRYQGQPAVGLAVVPSMPRDLVSFGDEVRAAADAVDLGDLQTTLFADQPAQVEQRLGDLSRSLVLGVLIVAIVLFVAMGPRLGLVVSSVVPLVALATVGVYAAGGGVLHQISIAALVLALGLLVDNAIVVAEAVQQHLDDDEGAQQSEAQFEGRVQALSRATRPQHQAPDDENTQRHQQEGDAADEGNHPQLPQVVADVFERVAKLCPFGVDRGADVVDRQGLHKGDGLCFLSLTESVVHPNASHPSRLDACLHRRRRLQPEQQREQRDDEHHPRLFVVRHHLAHGLGQQWIRCSHRVPSCVEGACSGSGGDSVKPNASPPTTNAPQMRGARVSKVDGTTR